jgi:UDP-N-acetyl-D-glucosamine dehydrogenase
VNQTNVSISTKAALIQGLQDKSARVGVLGMGYVGLPLAVAFAEAGFNVVGIDPEPRKVEAFRTGVSYIQDVSSETVARLRQAGRLDLTADFSALRDLDAVSICVPTPLRKTGDPDMSYVIAASEELAKHVHPGMVIVLESTTYPGTTRELLLPLLTEKSGLKAGEDIFICFSPERVDPGRTDWTTLNTPKVIGGITPACAQAGAAWYGSAIQTVVPVSSVEAAEMAKLLENTFRMINIGLVNEMAIMCERLGVDVWEVIEAAATKPFGFMKFTPGPGLGGHCIPVDPLYLSWKMRELNYSARFIELASEINTNMPRYVVSRVMEAMNDRGILLNGSRILILGVAYKPDVDDIRESPALDIIGLLDKKGARVSYHDPYIPEMNTQDGKLHLKSVSDLMAAVGEAEAVVIVTNHRGYDFDAIHEAAHFIFDSRNALGDLGRTSPKVVRL